MSSHTGRIDLKLKKKRQNHNNEKLLVITQQEVLTSVMLGISTFVFPWNIHVHIQLCRFQSLKKSTRDNVINPK